MMHRNNQKTGRTARARIAPEIEQAILRQVIEEPASGQDRVARELQAKGMLVSASGVRYVWQRHNLETVEKRVAFLEHRLAGTTLAWTPAQLAARERIRTDRDSRQIAAKLVGSGEFRRGEFILAIAARLFREQGYDATSLRDIARRAGIPVGSLYYHFPSKEELFAAVYEEGVRRLTDLVETSVAQAGTPIDRLHAACAAHIRLMCCTDDFTLAATPTRLPNVDSRIRANIVALNDRYEHIFKQLIAEIDLPAEVQPGLLRLQILGAMNWTATWFRPGKATPDDIAANLINALRLPLPANSDR